jgi:sulfate adenylyltransferase large subunit
MADVLRLCTAGSVDDGKSTLIGRLLYDSRSVYDDQVRAVEQASRRRSALPIDFSYFTDGLRAEREQGITIDVAYRYFATARRRFILADTPGHEQFTRNMATGASTSDLAILLVDARHGLRDQTRRHARIARLMGIRHFVAAVNKMDLIAFDRAAFARIVADFDAVIGGAAVQAIPISALHGDNVVDRSAKTPWYCGPALLEFLETVTVMAAPADAPLRLPVQYVVRGDGDFRGFAGQITSGRLRPGDAVRVWPSGRRAVVRRIVTLDGDREEAGAPASVTVVLDRELDLGRGGLIATGRPHVTRHFSADVVWMDERPLIRGRSYVLKHRTGVVRAEFDGDLELNGVADVRVATSRPLCLDRYADERQLGSFIVIDPDTGFTSGAGLVTTVHPDASTAAAGTISAAAAGRLARIARTASSEREAAVAVQRALEEIWKSPTPAS